MTIELRPEAPFEGVEESGPGDEVGAALERAVANLLSRQTPDGSWVGELESNAAITAEYLLMRRYLGIADRQREAAAIKYLRGQQRPDGSYGIAPEVDGDVSVTTEVRRKKTPGATTARPEGPCTPSRPTAMP